MSNAEDAGQRKLSAQDIDAMTDEEAAEYYYAHRNDPERPAEQVKIDVPGRLSRVVSVRFNPQEAAVIEARAKDAGMTMSAYVRHAALAHHAAGIDFVALEHMVGVTLERVFGTVVRQMAHVPDVLRHVARDVSQIKDKVG